MLRKKKVLLHSNSCLANTGFGRHIKYLLSYLFKTGKYDVIEYAAAPLTWSNPICKAMPWKCYGALPDNPAELERFRSDPAALQAIQYGAFNINRVLKEEKPDVMIMVEDIWGMPYFDRPWIGKFNHVFWTPIDSLPLLPIFKQQKDKFKHLWVKARFAQEALAEEGVESEYMPALIGKDEFTILSVDQKQAVRRKYGIADNTLLFGFVFRNQLRKLVGTLIEAFALFKKQHPKADAKLFLHTNWSEGEGWRIQDFASRFGVPMSDILTTYVCRECKSVSVKPFFGEELPCQACRSEKSVSTSSVAAGVTNEELCELYNMLDAYVHPATSGGFEMPVLEAIFSGIPAATTDYAYGKNFTINQDVFPLTFFSYSERGSQFDKAQVDPNSILEFMNKMYSMTKEERQALGEKVREWAALEFDGDKVCQKIEAFIDNLPFTDYDFNFEEESFDSIESIIDKDSTKKRILYVEPGSLGECLDSLVVLNKLEEKYPKEEWDYYISTVFPQMFDHLEFVKKTIPYNPAFEDVLAMEGIGDHKGFFDMAFHPKIARTCLDFYKNNY
jgi:glycosyltransferase involved in cell wall biosynthesis